jgi:hypothetical protein
MIRKVHPDPDLDFLTIPNQGVEKAPDPGSGSATLFKTMRFRKERGILTRKSRLFFWAIP